MFLFPDPIPCTGTLVAVNATGFCTLSGKVHQFDMLRILVLERTNNQFRRAGTTTVMADCQSTESSDDNAGESDYSIGTVSSQTVNISVCSGYYLAVRFSSITAVIPRVPFNQLPSIAPPHTSCILKFLMGV